MVEPKRTAGIPEGQVKYCEGCGAQIHMEAAVCPKCGYARKVDISSPKILAIAGLLLNVFVLPGLGTIVAGNSKTGIKQLVLFIVGIPLCLILIGFFILLGVWIWALVTSINQLTSSP